MAGSPQQRNGWLDGLLPGSPKGADCVHDPARGLFGSRSPHDRLNGLQALQRRAEGLSLLDLGCAEGHVARYFLDGGVRLAHGVDKHRRRIASARRLTADPRARFERGDIADRPGVARACRLEAAYDVVLTLDVYQQLAPETRRGVLAGLTGLCRKWFPSSTSCRSSGSRRRRS